MEMNELLRFKGQEKINVMRIVEIQDDFLTLIFKKLLNKLWHVFFLIMIRAGHCRPSCKPT